jgi:uncharacterized membrane protein YbhN (UPF0104 family)
LVTPKLRTAFGLGITFITIGLFVYYLVTHASLWHQLMTTRPITILTLLVIFGFWFASMALILVAILRICNIEIPLRNNLLINAYSTFINYFLPGQGGPVLRGLYLKGRYKLPFSHYIFATLTYYVFYAGVAMLLLLGAIDSWWDTLFGVVVVSVLAFAGSRYYARKHRLNGRGLNFSLPNLAFLLFATCVQAICQVAIYWVELNSVAPGFKIDQVMSYTGAANFALFVNLTPGAVGIRETFLLFSQKIHHFTNAAIVGSNILDRSVYIIFLAVIFVVLLVARGKSAFPIKGNPAIGYLSDTPPAPKPEPTKTY